MPHILEDRILESTTTTGTGDITLAAAILGFRRFNAVCAVADTLDYFIEAIDSVGLPTGDYEYGKGTYSAANTLTRTTVLGSSNAGAAVNFAAGSKNVGIGLQAALFARLQAASGYQKFPGGLIVQWGRATLPNSGVSSSNVAVTLPITFPAAIRAVIATGLESANTTGSAPVLFATALALGGFTLFGDTNDAAVPFNKTCLCNYVAIGH